MKKIVVINSSLKGRASSTLNITNAFLEGYQLVNESVEIQYFHLAEMTIHPCIDCDGCSKNSNGVCHLVDDMALILEQYKRADLIIHSFSLNYNGVTSLLQKYNERIRPLRNYVIEDELGENIAVKWFYDRPTDDKFVIISTCRPTNIKEAYKAVNVQVNQNFNNKATKLFFPSTLYPYVNTEISGIDFYKAIQWAGQDFARDGKISDSIYDILYRFCPSTDQDIVIPSDFANKHYEFDSNYEKLNLIGLGKLSSLKKTYTPSRLNTQEKILEIEFLDLNESYHLILKEEEFDIIPKGKEKPHGKLITQYKVFDELMVGKTDLLAALKSQVITYSGEKALFKAIHNGLLYTPNKKKEDISLLLSNGMSHKWVDNPLNRSFFAFLPILFCLVVCAFTPESGLPFGVLISLLPLLAKRSSEITVFDKCNLLIFLLSNIVVFLLSKLYPFHDDDIFRVIAFISAFFYGASLSTKVPLTAYLGYWTYDVALENIEVYVKKHQLITFIIATIMMLIPLVHIVSIFLEVKSPPLIVISVVGVSLLVVKWISLTYGHRMYVKYQKGHSQETYKQKIKI